MSRAEKHTISHNKRSISTLRILHGEASRHPLSNLVRCLPVNGALILGLDLIRLKRSGGLLEDPF